jgi:4'-phosphopantetheinyl transferase
MRAKPDMDCSSCVQRGLVVMVSLSKELRSQQMVQVFATAIKDVPPRFFCEDLLPFLTPQKKERLERFVHAEDVLRALMGERLIRDIVKREFALEDAAIRIVTNAYGKPFLSGYPGFHFNLSHSGRWVVCAVGAQQVGIDVEQTDKTDWETATSFFSDEEKHDLWAKSAADMMSHFYQIWTLKESFVKCTGRGFSTDPGSFTIKMENDRIYLRDSFDAIDDRYCFKIFDLDCDYVLAACSEGETFANDITKV